METEKKRDSIEKKGFIVLDSWLKNYREGKRIETFFEDNDYHSIAIYGMGRLAEHILIELEESSIKIEYGIDQKADQIYNDKIEIVRPADIMKMKKVDAVIVTPLHCFNEIEVDLMDLGYDGEILSISQIVSYVGQLESL